MALVEMNIRTLAETVARQSEGELKFEFLVDLPKDVLLKMLKPVDQASIAPLDSTPPTDLTGQSLPHRRGTGIHQTHRR